jgi:hypothetical protein
MEISEIAPILRADKITPTISAEKNGKIRVTYTRGNGSETVLDLHRDDWPEGGMALGVTVTVSFSQTLGPSALL